MRHRKSHTPQPLYVRVWDAPTLLFHWTIVSLLACSWYSADQGLMTFHLWSGSMLLTLLLFRIVWGIIGSTTARFSDFLRGPTTVVDYFRALSKHDKPKFAGHNPAGGLMVTVLIATLLAQAATGVFSNDGVRFHGPLALLVSADTSDRLTELHGAIFDIILVFVWLHLVAVFFYLLVKGENLVKPMVTGYKHRHHLPRSMSLEFVHWGVALAVLLTAAGIVGWFLLQQ